MPIRPVEWTYWVITTIAGFVKTDLSSCPRSSMGWFGVRDRRWTACEGWTTSSSGLTLQGEATVTANGWSFQWFSISCLHPIDLQNDEQMPHDCVLFLDVIGDAVSIASLFREIRFLFTAGERGFASHRFSSSWHHLYVSSVLAPIYYWTKFGLFGFDLNISGPVFEVTTKIHTGRLCPQGIWSSTPRMSSQRLRFNFPRDGRIWSDALRIRYVSCFTIWLDRITGGYIFSRTADDLATNLSIWPYFFRWPD